MRCLKRSAVSLLALLALTACTPADVVSVGDYCIRAARPTMVHLCGPDEQPVADGAGFYSCTAFHIDDGRTVATEAKKYDDACPSPNRRPHR